MKFYLAVPLLLSAFCCAAQKAPAISHSSGQIPRFQHVFVVVEENEGYAQVIGNQKDLPYLNELADRYGVATNYFANTHPSINNYFYLTAGRSGTIPPWIRGLADEYPLDVGGQNIASILSAAGKSWKSYADGLRRVGDVGDGNFPYVKRHNPFAYFETVRTSASERQHIVPFDQFKRDFEKQSLPDFSFIVPDIYHDGHDNLTRRDGASCGDSQALRQADDWLKDNIRPLIDSAMFQQGGLLIIVYDEACDKDHRLDPTNAAIRGGGRIPAIIVSARTPLHARSAVLFHHESTLRLTLKALGIDHFPGLSASTPDMDEFFTSDGNAVTGPPAE
jgi:phospholipase C